MKIPIEFRQVFLSVISFLLWVPFFYNVAVALFPAPKSGKRVAIGFSVLSLVSLIYGLLTTSPYLSWFGKIANGGSVHLEWWPRYIFDLPHIPNEAGLFLGLWVSGFLIIYFFLEGKRLYFFAWVLILLQAFLHLSLHSPYSYLPHFEQPAAANYWYHSYLFPNSVGAVNEDYYWFWQSEALFLGHKGQLSLFWSRLLPYFLSSRLSTFIHPLFAWIILSSMFWLLSVRAVYFIASLYFDRKVATYASVIQMSSPAMIVYIGQAKPYAVSFAIVALLVAVFLSLMKVNYRIQTSALHFGICLGVALLCYELQPWLLVFPIWARALKIRWMDILLFLLIGLVVYLGFGLLSKYIPQVTLKETFQPGYGSPLKNAFALICSGDFGRIWETLHYSLKSWWVLSFHAFSTILPLTLLGGIWLCLKGLKGKEILLTLLPGIIAVLLIGVTNQSLYFQYGRMVFGNYVGMMILASIGLRYFEEKRYKNVPSVLLGLNTVYWNLDVWGAPAIYFHWFYRFPSFANWF